MTSEASPPLPRREGPYQLFILALCVYALASLVATTILPASSGTRQILDMADFGVCAVFFADFVYQLVRAPRKWHYFITWGWIDLVSSIPTVDFLRVGRAARIMRIFRILRGVRSTKVLAAFILGKRTESAFLAVALISMVLLVFGSVAVLGFEQGAEGANIKTPGDALWWSFVTITTVGYGDKFPVTMEGRFIASVLIPAGVGLFGALSGFVASWFLAPGEKQQESEMAQLHKEVAELRRAVERLAPEKET
jgi:voltage-gated potassium channel